MERTVKTYTKTQREYMRRPKLMRDKNWFYIGRGECSFHNDMHGGEGVCVPTHTLLKALKLAGLIP